MRLAVVLASLSCAAPAAAQTALSPADEAAAFTAAGFKRVNGQWRACEDPGTPSYTPGAIEQVVDLNGDGHPEAIISEGGAFCYGNTGTGYALVSKQAGGDWKLITSSHGIPILQDTKGVGGWPDIMNGGPGFCFAVWRWNGSAYEVHRYEYEGKPCKPPE